MADGCKLVMSKAIRFLILIVWRFINFLFHFLHSENDARRADANPRAGWQGSVHVGHPNIGFRVSKKWRK